MLDGTQKPRNVAVATYSHAQKIRAAMTYVFGRVYELGSIVWHQDEKNGRCYGNPSVSQKVSSYMVSLRNRKARSGETPTSARAITTVRTCFFISNFNSIKLILLHQGRPQKAI